MFRTPLARRLLCLLGVALFFFPHRVALANPAEVSDLINRHALEVALLHLPIDRTVLGSLPVWDDKLAKLRLRTPGENFDVNTRPILILHLWATWCGPCKDEFPLWRQIEERLEKKYGTVHETSIVHIAMQKDDSGMASFVRQLGDKLPASAKFFDRDEQLLKVLRQAFKGADLPTLPITLWLGPARTVKQAMAGTIQDRVPEVMDSTDRLIRSIRYLQNENKKVPKDEEIDVFTRLAPCSCPCICN
jgi:thiol-disulfide isomerase/thioredoxin